tara:strand:- start:414 stop:737 length:324 start_codon:yes stop_codon:yes gene_type:complete
MKVSIKKSTLKNKKFTAVFFQNDKKIKTTHFGQRGAPDYTILSKTLPKNEALLRKLAYINRHSKEAELWKSDPMSAATLSKFINWNKETFAASLKDYLKTFKLQLNS